MGISRIWGVLTTTASFWGWTPWASTNREDGRRLSSPRASPSIPMWLDENYGSIEYPDYDWVDHVWWGAPENQVIWRSPIWVLFQPWWLNLGVPMGSMSRPWIRATQITMTKDGRHFEHYGPLPNLHKSFDILFGIANLFWAQQHWDRMIERLPNIVECSKSRTLFELF